MAFQFNKSMGMMALAIYLIVVGLMGLVALPLPPIVFSVLALVAGVLILVGR
jgi:hypothetical protein